MIDESGDIESLDLMQQLPVPEPVYKCTDSEGRQEHSWPADELEWFSGREEGIDGDNGVQHAVAAGWYCTQCCEHLDIECNGPALSDVLAARTGAGDRMPDEGMLIEALDKASEKRWPHAAAVHEVARAILAHTAGGELLPAYDPDTPLEGGVATPVAMAIANREINDPAELRPVTLSGPLATRVGIELQHMSLILQKADTANSGSRERVQ